MIQSTLRTGTLAYVLAAASLSVSTGCSSSPGDGTDTVSVPATTSVHAQAGGACLDIVIPIGCNGQGEFCYYPNSCKDSIVCLPSAQCQVACEEIVTPVSCRDGQNCYYANSCDAASHTLTCVADTRCNNTTCGTATCYPDTNYCCNPLQNACTPNGQGCFLGSGGSGTPGTAFGN